MKTLQDLYIEIKDDDEQKQAFVEAVKANDIASFLKQNDCDATQEEVREFLEAKMAEDSPLELSMDELEDVAGGSIFSSTCHCSNKETCANSNTCIRDCC